MKLNMKKCLFFGLLFLSAQAFGQKPIKYDSTLKIGKAGFRIMCLNKSADENSLTIKPIGFSNQAREANLLLKGKVASAEVDDLNNDGFPDLIIYVIDKSDRINVFSLTSKNNERMELILFPDITNDMQLSKGYRGKDDFKLVEGILFRKFPIYDLDTNIKIPTNKVRQIMYRVVAEDDGYLKFKSFKNLDLDVKP
jgi:hypothetical protein